MSAPVQRSSPKQKVLTLLRKAHKPLSAYAILDALRASGVRSPPTVYRALEELEATGFVHRIESLGAYVACCHDHPHEADEVSSFAICKKCGSVSELSDPTLVKALKKMGHEFLATTESKVLEISGLCHGCQGKSPSKRGAPCSR